MVQRPISSWTGVPTLAGDELISDDFLHLWNAKCLTTYLVHLAVGLDKTILKVSFFGLESFAFLFTGSVAVRGSKNIVVGSGSWTSMSG